MSPSELCRLAKGKHKSPQQSGATCSAEPSSPPRSDFAELVWENGRVVMQGQLNRAKKHTSNYNIRVEDSPQNSRFKDEALAKGDHDSEMRLGRVGMMESSILNDFHIPVPSDLDDHDDMVPWLSYQMDEPVQHNYSNQFFTELSDVTANVTPLEKRGDSVRAIKEKDSHPASLQNPVPAGFEQLNLLPARPKVGQFNQTSSLQSQYSFPSFRSKALETNSICHKKTMENLSFGGSAKKQCPSSVYPSIKMQTQDQGQRLPTASIMNFSHFSKHASVVKSSLDTICAKAGPQASTAERIDGKDKWSVLTGVKPADPSQVASISGQQREPAVLLTVDGSKLSMAKPNGNPAAGNVEKAAEPVVASSICSRNSADRASNDPIIGTKRKYGESEDSQYQSEDVEEESVGIKKATTNRVGSGSKRSRAAEVHNLSERRRRDRINEKMRALQELIPHCNKVDKASMLDEAIEYLKTLQIQVQMMSMGSGLCMPPMMMPHTAHMPRFSPMTVGMGMGMGYGLGMLDMSGPPSNCHLVQMPGTQFSMAPVNAPLQNIPMFGFQGQGHVAMPMSCAPAMSYPVCPPSRPLMDLNTLNPALPAGNICSAQTPQANEAVQNVSVEEVPNSDGNFLQGLELAENDHAPN